MKNRLLFLKRLYKDYVIVFYKNSYYVYGNDYLILKYFKDKSIINTLDKLSINYIVVDNLDIKVISFDKNNYLEYVIKSHIVNTLKMC